MGLTNRIDRGVSRFLRQRQFSVYPDRMTAGRFAALVVRPDLVIDVGVGSGTPWLYACFPDLPFLLVDPMAGAGDTVAAAWPDLRAEFIETALGERDGQATLNIPIKKGSTRSHMASLLDRRDSHMKGVTGFERREVAVTTLDAIARDRPGRLGLKIDAEGAEPAILRGATETLERCDFVVLELSLSRRFAEAEPPSRVVALLAAAGLEFRDVLDMNGMSPTESPRHIDALFTRWQDQPNLS